MKTLNFQQGSDQWHKARIAHRTASVAGVVMMDSKLQTRSDLIKAIHSGKPQEFSRYVEEVIFPDGHALEALARPIAEKLLFDGDDLYQPTVTDDSGYLLASLDGAPLTYEKLWEHKQWNEALAKEVKADKVPLTHAWQLEQQLLVTGAESIFFMVSDGTEENMEWTEYKPVRGRAKKLLAGWAQFEKDLLAYEPELDVEPEVLTPEPILGLTSLMVTVVGEVKDSNMVAYMKDADAFFANAKTELVTDQDFIDAAHMVKFCGENEDGLKQVKKNALAQTASLDELFKAVDLYIEKFRRARLDSDNQIKSEKQKRKDELVEEGTGKVLAALAAANADIAPLRITDIEYNFANAIKGRSALKSIKSEINNEVTRAQLRITEISDKYKANAEMVKTNAPDHQFLFSDLQVLVELNEGHLEMSIKARIDEYEAKLLADKQAEEDADKKRQEEAAASTEEDTSLPDEHGVDANLGSVAADDPASDEPERKALYRSGDTCPIEDGGNGSWVSEIDVGEWEGRISVYGNTEAEAAKLRNGIFGLLQAHQESKNAS